MARQQWLVDYLATRKKLSDLDVKARREARQAADKIGTVLLRSIKAALRNDYTGLLRKSLGKRVQTYRNGKTVVVAGVRRGFRVVISALVEKARGVFAIGKRDAGKGKPAKEIKLKAPGSVAAGAAHGKVLNPAKYGPLVEHGHRSKGGKLVGPFAFVKPGASAAQSEVYSVCRSAVISSVKGS